MALVEICEEDVRFDEDESFVLNNLFMAAKAGDAEEFRTELQRLGPDVNLDDRNLSGETVVHMAALGGSLEILECLINRCIDLQQPSQTGDSALHWAVRLGNLSMVKYIKEQCVSLDCQNRVGEAPIHLAAKKNHLQILDYLCISGANINLEDKNGETPVMCCAALGALDCVKTLIHAGAHINREDKNGWTPLQHAIKRHETTIALMLINAGAKIDHVDMKRDTPLHIACREGLLPVVQALCAYGCRVDIYNAVGVTPLHIASKSGCLEIVRCLLLAGGNPQLPSKDGVYPEVMSLTQGHTNIASLLTRMKPEKRAICVEQLVPTSRSLPRIKLKMFGHTMSGKTTLIESLQSNVFTGFFRKKFKSTEQGPSFEEGQYFSLRQRTLPSELNYEVQHENYTRGININNININGVGEFCVWEFSGYEPYYLAYDHFIGDTSCIHVVLFNLMDSLELMRIKVMFWLNFLKARIPAREPLGFCGKPRSMGRILLVGTHLDRASSFRDERGLLNNKDANQILLEARREFRYTLEFCDEVFVINCNDSLSAEMKAFKSQLCNLRAEILKRLPHANGFLDVVCSKIPDWVEGSQFPVFTWQQFVDQVRSQVNPLCSEDHLKDLIQELQYIGEVVYIESETDHDMIVLNPRWLCGDIIGYILSFDNISQARVTGSFTLDDFQFMVAESNAKELLRILIALSLATSVEVEEEVQFEFPCLNFLETIHGLWEKESRHEASFYGGIQYVSAKGQLVHIFARIQSQLRRSLALERDEEENEVTGQADLYQWFHGSKLTYNMVECLLTMEENDQVIQLKARGPKDQNVILFGLYQDILNLIEQTIEEMCPSLEYEVYVMSASDLKEHRRLPRKIHQSLIFCTMFNQRRYNCSEKSRKQLDVDSNTTANKEVERLKDEREIDPLFGFLSEAANTSKSSAFLENNILILEEELENLLCFGSKETLFSLKWGPELHVSSLRTPTFQRLCLHLDPPDHMGRDWCLLAVRLGLTESVPKIDTSNEWLRSRTAKILDEWGHEAESSIGHLIDILTELNRADAVATVMETAPLYHFAPSGNASTGANLGHTQRRLLEGQN